MKTRGAVLVDPADIPTAETIDDCELEILLYEFKADLNAYLAGLGPSARVHSLTDVIAFNEREKARDAILRPGTLVPAQKKGPLTRRRIAGRCSTVSRAPERSGLMP